MDIREIIKKERVIIDGGMGSLLQQKGLKPGELPERWNLSHSDIITDIFRAYIEAGSQIVTANTFGLNSFKYSNAEIEEITKAAVDNAKNAGAAFVAYDMGPCGRLLKPWGDLDFEDAVELFKEQALCAEKYGADLIIIETMSDSYETKAALLAVKENTDLPVFVSNAYSSDGRLLTGASPAAMVAMLEGLGADAIGANCSLGPKQLMPIMKEIARYASVPIFVQPNAGLPAVKNGETFYDIDASEFAKLTASMSDFGVSIFGGCCGTGPEHIRLLCDELKEKTIKINTAKSYTIVSSYSHAVLINSDGAKPLIIGERINPSGNKKLREAIEKNDIDFVLKLGLDQEEAGADALDVNAGLPGTDESTNLTRLVRELQTVTALPLQIDSANADAMEKAARVYNGKPLLNSVNGKDESLKAVLPIAKKYGGVLVCLCLDESGIPSDAEGRFKIAEKIVKRAAKCGIDKKNLIFDTLTMPVSAGKNSARVTLDTLTMIKDRLRCASVLGVSNISFGLPNRAKLNSSFFTMALTKGLSAGIINPMSEDMMNAYHGYCALSGLDESFERYIKYASTMTQTPVAAAAVQESDADSLQTAIIKGLKSKAAQITTDYLKTMEPLSIINGHIIPALDVVGKGFEDGSLYLPQLLLSAEAAKGAFEIIKNSDAMKAAAKNSYAEKFVIATVKGDIHDIGKNIVKLLLSNYGFDVIDLGKDVDPKDILNAIDSSGARLCGLSALMTTTVPAMEESIKLIKYKYPQCRVIVGGAVLNEQYAQSIGADYYAKDAMATVRYSLSMI